MAKLPRCLARSITLAACALLHYMPVAAATGDGEFTGVDSCKGCHAQEYEAWQGSHHDLAMQLPTADTVLGDFNDSRFEYAGITTTFRREGDQFTVRTDGPDGELTDFAVAYVFGVYPLQQYLLPLSGGRLQALSIAWDARPSEQGGQRWFHLYPDDAIDYQDPLHWTGPYQNWNSRCAECHSTDLEKNYDPETRSFNTRFAEIDVACEACHGPGRQHLQLAKAGKLTAGADSGFATRLDQRGHWQFAQDAAIARRSEALTSNAQIDSCGRCHSRRGTLGDYHYGANLLDTHRLALPEAPLYYHDGQIRDEDYVYGSFVQSKMHGAGVVCSNCHEPHSNALRAPGNAVCAQCHQPQKYDSASHHHHKNASEGASCANCHMPETTYMEVDPRRDHSIRIPRPDLSVVMDTPNACNQCHRDQDAHWALAALREWGVDFRDTSRHPARAFAQVAEGDQRGLPRLAELAGNPKTANIWRATALEALGRAGHQEGLALSQQLLLASDPLLRNSAVRSLEALPLNQRFRLLQGLLADPNASVRLSVAENLAAVPLDQLTKDDAARLGKLFEEYTAVSREHADMPGAQLQLGIFLTNRGDAPAAEAAYREALRLNPQLIPARLNLADLLRSQQREDEAREQLLQALEVVPEHGATLHALGLLATRSGERDAALDYLQRAALLEQDGTRHRFVYAIALHDLGQPEQAVSQLKALQKAAPDNEDVLLALANYSTELGQLDAARGYILRLQELSPQNPAYPRLLQSLPTR